MSTKIYVGGLARETTVDELQLLFAQYGSVSEVSITRVRAVDGGGNCGHIAMTNAAEALKAITHLHGKDFGGRKLTVNQARPLRTT